MDKTKQVVDESLAGSYHELSESKIAPMLVTGSYVGWLVYVINKYLEGGRLKKNYFSPYLSEPEGLKAVYQYAQRYQEPVTHETALLINHLCYSDPFFIAGIILSDYEEKDLTNVESVKKTVEFEISDRRSNLSEIMADIVYRSLSRINNTNAKHIAWFFCQHPGERFTHHQIKKELNLDLEPNEILKVLEKLVAGDLIEDTTSNIAFKGLTDGALNLILRNRLEEEIMSHPFDFERAFNDQIEALKKEKRSLQNALNSLVGQMAEEILANDMRARYQFSPKLYFPDMTVKKQLTWTDIKVRDYFKRPDGKNVQFDIKATAQTGEILFVE
ncbi:MAG: hypothetical protein GY757_53910, partial [bacterium]|nr:hypothetical protein [bacterium]